MTAGELKTRIIGFMNRDLSSFNKDGQDGVLSAINMSIEFAQQLVDFEMGLEIFEVTLDTAGTDWTSMTNGNGTFNVSKIHAIYDADWKEVPMITGKDRLLGLETDAVMIQGKKLFPIGDGGVVNVAAFTKLPLITLDTDTNYLLEYASTWLTYSCIGHLNFYLKEDQRVQLSTTILSTSWQAVITWNNRLNENVTSLDLE